MTVEWLESKRSRLALNLRVQAKITHRQPFDTAEEEYLAVLIMHDNWALTDDIARAELEERNNAPALP